MRDPGIVGRTIAVNGTPAAIIGVVPEHSGFPTSGKMWLPLSMMPGLAGQARDARSLGVIARIRRDVDLAYARADVESIAMQLAAEYPPTNTKVRARVVPVNEQYQGSITHPGWRAFIGVGVIVVLISCANAANLMLARALNRSREIAIRTSLGASRLRVVRQLCIEGATLAALAGAVGLGRGHNRRQAVQPGGSGGSAALLGPLHHRHARDHLARAGVFCHGLHLRLAASRPRLEGRSDARAERRRAARHRLPKPATRHDLSRRRIWPRRRPPRELRGERANDEAGRRVGSPDEGLGAW